MVSNSLARFRLKKADVARLSVKVKICIVSIVPLTDGNTKESINLRVYNSDFTTTNAEMLKMVEKADLEGHGFQKEETRTMLSTGKATNHSAYMTTLYYYKVVDCLQVIQVLKEVEKLLPG